MASRMDRYHKSELITSGRSSKNKSLYDQIKDLDNYTNIEGVATIEKTNEIDISKVREMIKNREISDASTEIAMLQYTLNKKGL